MEKSINLVAKPMFTNPSSTPVITVTQMMKSLWRNVVGLRWVNKLYIYSINNNLIGDQAYYPGRFFGFSCFNCWFLFFFLDCFGRLFLPWTAHSLRQRTRRRGFWRGKRTESKWKSSTNRNQCELKNKVFQSASWHSVTDMILTDSYTRT